MVLYYFSIAKNTANILDSKLFFTEEVYREICAFNVYSMVSCT